MRAHPPHRLELHHHPRPLALPGPVRLAPRRHAPARPHPARLPAAAGGQAAGESRVGARSRGATRLGRRQPSARLAARPPPARPPTATLRGATGVADRRRCGGWLPRGGGDGRHAGRGRVRSGRGPAPLARLLHCIHAGGCCRCASARRQLCPPARAVLASSGFSGACPCWTASGGAGQP